VFPSSLRTSALRATSSILPCGRARFERENIGDVQVLVLQRPLRIGDVTMRFSGMWTSSASGRRIGQLHQLVARLQRPAAQAIPHVHVMIWPLIGLRSSNSASFALQSAHSALSETHV